MNTVASIVYYSYSMIFQWSKALKTGRQKMEEGEEKDEHKG